MRLICMSYSFSIFCFLDFNRFISKRVTYYFRLITIIFVKFLNEMKAIRLNFKISQPLVL